MYTFIYIMNISILSLHTQSSIDRCSKYAKETTSVKTALKVTERQQQHRQEVTLDFLFVGAGPVAGNQFGSGRPCDQPTQSNFPYFSAVL
jgi:hypothetical protein